MGEVQEIEELFTPQELAKMFKFDESTIRRWFYDEPGVLHNVGGKKKHVTLRIPKSVALRVYRKRMQKAG